MNNPLISVIVPIYNVERYLRTCIDSIVNQTYSNLEIILVDDGSPDKCPELCDEYAENDNRVKVIHQKNGGLAHARNVGLENSSGKYVLFVDSDDFIACESIEYLYKGLVKQKADISIGSFTSFCDGKHVSCSVDYVDYVDMRRDECFERYASIDAKTSMPLITAWNKLYKKDLFNGVKYPEGKLYEDAFTTYRVLDKARRVVVTPMILYFYRLNPQSILGQPFKEKHFEMVEAFRGAMDYFYQKEDFDIAEMFLPPLLMREIYCWWGVKYVLKNKKMASRVLNDYRNDCKKMKNTNEKRKIIFCLLAFFPFLYSIYRKCFSRHIGDR